MPAEAAPSRLHLPDLPGEGETLSLPTEEAHYLRRVVRARPGERVSATDGRGAVATLVLESDGTAVRARVERIERRVRAREAWLLCGAPEGTRADWLVEKAGELGIAVLQFLDLERGRFDDARGRRERWERLAIAALRQSRAAFRLEVRTPVALEAALATLPPGAERFVADPDGGRMSAPPAGRVVGAVGPAAGFSATERERLKEAGFRPQALADERLRSETAALAWACWWAGGS